VNSVIEGTETQVGLMNWKKKHLNNSEIDDSCGSLGTRYWQTFAAKIPPSLAQIKLSDLTANKMFGVVWIILRICMMMCMKNCGKQALQKS
jgi:hypothetical protein